MQLAIHLFVESASDPADLLNSGTDADRPELLDPRLPLDFACVAVSSFRQHRRPTWAEYVEPYFDVDWRGSVVTSMAVLVRADDRWFAVTFGQGRHLLRSELLEPDFGIRVVANSVGDGLRSIESRTVDRLARTTTQRIALPGRLVDFTVDPHAEWVRSLGAWTDGDLTTAMTGSQALAVELPAERTDLKQLHGLLIHLLERYRSGDYRSRFPFLDSFAALPLRDPRIPALDSELTAMLERGDFGLVEPSDQPGDPDHVRYRLLARNGEPYAFFDAQAVRSVAGRVRHPLSLRVATLDRDGARLGTRSLRDHLSVEIDRGRLGFFVLADGRWFSVDPTHVTQLASDLEAIEELDAAEFGLAPWYRGHREETYCRGSQYRFLLMDQDFFLGPDPRRDKIEICDLASAALELVCVKRLRGAASMSHLFSQGSVSARFYRQDSDYRAELHDRVLRRWPAADLGRRPPKIVYAIGTDRRGSVRRTLPFFSRMNLRGHVRSVLDCRLDVAVTRIPMVSTPATARPLAERIPVSRSEPAGQAELFDLDDLDRG